MLETTYISVIQEIEVEIASGNRGDDEDWYKHIPNEKELADYAHEPRRREVEIASGNRGDDEDWYKHIPNEKELADYAHEDLVDCTDYTGPNIPNESLSGDEQRKLVDVLKNQEGIMIASATHYRHPHTEWFATSTTANTSPSVGEAVQILERTIGGTFSDSSWASPIVIVLKKNGVGIRLCIGYKRVNAVTTIMEYAMPLADALLTDMDAYLCFCSLDAASGF
ncbi:hypothetical protein PHMEG_0003908 [Phytophthora megakarya]|uniref:Reverse transcriptase n=1 Tax=Phytophthora megakarya TaxID=4795 RepID=A0A225WV18_9STRA|nr:hypothetical protein PHMEG_0003908 [Phytophthora megakarya]